MNYQVFDRRVICFTAIEFDWLSKAVRVAGQRNKHHYVKRVYMASNTQSSPQSLALLCTFEKIIWNTNRYLPIPATIIRSWLSHPFTSPHIPIIPHSNHLTHSASHLLRSLNITTPQTPQSHRQNLEATKFIIKTTYTVTLKR